MRCRASDTEIDGGGEFLDWYERAFLKPLGQGGAKR